MILALLLLVAIGGLSGAVLSSMRLSRTTEETALADEAARALAGNMQIVNFLEIFRRYDGSTADDAGLAGAVPGATFDVKGLAPRRDDADGHVGRIVFPSVPAGPGFEALREDVVDERMGMSAGLDLNGDGDALDDVTNAYLLLPVRLIVEWTGAGGDRSYEIDLLLTP
jgi:hypothetical protein